MATGERSKSSFASSTALLLLVMFGLYGCATLPTSRMPPEQGVKTVDSIQTPVAPEKTSGPATSLYQKAKQSVNEGRLDQAEVLIERALRIEPGNGYYWYTLALIKFERGEYGQTMQLCRKSKSLATGDDKLMRLSDSLMRRVP